MADKLLMPLCVAIPLGMGFFIAAAARQLPRLADLLANLTTLSLVIISFLLLGRQDVLWVGGWMRGATGSPLGIALVLDGLSAFMVVVIAIVSFAATLFSVRYMDLYTARAKYYALFLIMVAGMNGAVLTGDMFNLYVFLEIAAVSSYALVGFGCEQDELEASFKYLVLGSVASCFVLLAIALIYSISGTLNMAYLARKIEEIRQAGGSASVVTFAVVLFMAGLGLKAALVPFHAWLPDAHPSAPAPISAMLSGVLIKAIGVCALIRIVFNVFGFTQELSYALMLLGTLSMVVGVMLAIGQWDFKRLLAYHSISQIGYVILGIGLGTPLGILGGLFHLANHAVFKSLLFLNAGAVEYATGTRQMEEMGGLRKKMPITGNTCLIASMSIAGIPPFNGFFSKLIIIFACVQAGRYGFAAWAVFVSIITLASFMKVQKYVFFGELKERWNKVREVPFFMTAAMILLAVLCLAMSCLVLPGLREGFLDPAQRALHAGLEYGKFVLSACM